MSNWWLEVEQHEMSSYLNRPPRTKEQVALVLAKKALHAIMLRTDKNTGAYEVAEQTLAKIKVLEESADSP